MKNTFLQSPVYNKRNSTWAIEKPCCKTCSRKGFLRVICATITRVTQTQCLPVSPSLDLDEIQGSKKHSGTWFHPTRLYSAKTAVVCRREKLAKVRNNSWALSEFDCCFLVLKYRRFLKANFNMQFDDQLEFYNVPSKCVVGQISKICQLFLFYSG